MSTTRPVLFSAPMVRELLAGKKTQTRRVVKGNPIGMTSFIGRDNKPTHRFGVHYTHERVINKHVACPYGVPGDKLWVRETWATWASVDNLSPSETGVIDAKEIRLWYRSDGCCSGVNRGQMGKWRPSIHMPRWASRITLEITDVRVEKLTAISEIDAAAEGIPVDNPRDLSEEYGNASYLIQRFSALWETINGAGSWEANPWVWVLEFRRVQGGAT